ELVSPRDGGGDEGDGLRVDGEVNELDEWEPGLRGPRTRELRRRDRALLDERADDPLLVLWRRARSQRLDGDESSKDEDFGDRRHRSGGSPDSARATVPADYAARRRRAGLRVETR